MSNLCRSLILSRKTGSFLQGQQYFLKKFSQGMRYRGLSSTETLGRRHCKPSLSEGTNNFDANKEFLISKIEEAIPACGSEKVFPHSMARKVIQEEAEALMRLADSVDSSFDDAVSMLEKLDASSRVIVVGIGKSGHLGRKIAATFSSTGTSALFMHATEALHGDLGVVRGGDVVLLLSNSGETQEVIDVARSLRDMRVKTIAVCSSKSSTLSSLCSLCIPIGKHKELDHNGLAPTASAIVMMSIGDALAVVLSKRKRFSKKDFSRCHPAGEIGKAARD